jgi:DNA modification methylase
MSNLPKPYYEHAGITIYHADCRDILQHLPKVDLVLTDPPYGIGADKGRTEKVISGVCQTPRRVYADSWDVLPEDTLLHDLVQVGRFAVIWGGNYFSHCLPPSKRWLVLEKQNTMPTFSDCELAWTNADQASVKMLSLNGNGLMAKERERWHPTQKPVELMSWCVSLFPNAETIFDPFMGSGTTLIAAKLQGKRAIGIEREEKYCEIAVQRLGQDSLFMEESA